MLTLPTTRAAAGMKLALPVVHPDKPGYVLLKPGCELDSAAIVRMNELGVRRIAIEYPPTAFLLRYARADLLNAQSEVAQAVAGEMDKMSTGLHTDFDLQVYVEGVRGLIQKLVDDPAAALFMHDIVDARKPLASHAFNVGFLSLLIGLKLDGYLVANRARITHRRAMNTEALGLGALLHDIGMTRLPAAVVARFEQTRDDTDPAWRAHVTLGFDLVKGRIPATASAAVLHHHQRLDGSGFPERTRGFGPPSALRGEEIHTFARIIAVADVFDRLRNPPGNTDDLGNLRTGPVPTVRALRDTLIQVRAGKLDPVVFKALLAVVPAFAPGTIVTLNDDRRCVVTGWDPTQPCSPMVSVLPASLDEAIADPSHIGKLHEESLGQPIDLTERRDLRIMTADGHNVRSDLFEPQREFEFDLRVPHPGQIGEAWQSILESTIAAGGRVG
jgi:HD-GYP domain-containing protein (c-di-GMP phosphodiesterase class II)